MNLIIDAGNSRVKIYHTEGTDFTTTKIFASSDDKHIYDFLSKLKWENCILSNVGAYETDWINLLSEKSEIFLNLNSETPLPIKNLYETPETLGNDRLANAVGADYLYPGESVLAIDTGTAITYDLVVHHAYIGGAIAPGMQLRFDALHQHTKRLPLLDYYNDYEIPGKSTRDSILNGVIQGICNEIKGTINTYKEEYSGLIAVITGGDADIFAKMIKNGIFAEPYLLAKGLNRILNYNVEKT